MCMADIFPSLNILGLTTAVVMVRRLSIPVLCHIRQCRIVSFSWDTREVWYGTKT